MNIRVTAVIKLQSVHHQHAHMISDGHATGQSQRQTKFASSVFAGRRCHESLFHTHIVV